MSFAPQGRNKHLSSANERMEMELLYSRAIDMNGGLGDSDDGVGTEKGPSILRQKYERAAKDLEYAKKRLAQQHEDDMEQLMALKKQLEKKVTSEGPFPLFSKKRDVDHGRIRTCNLLIRSQTRCPLRHAATVG